MFLLVMGRNLGLVGLDKRKKGNFVAYFGLNVYLGVWYGLLYVKIFSQVYELFQKRDVTSLSIEVLKNLYN